MLASSRLIRYDVIGRVGEDEASTSERCFLGCFRLKSFGHKGFRTASSLTDSEIVTQTNFGEAASE